jgi:hypothetical protein
MNAGVGWFRYRSAAWLQANLGDLSNRLDSLKTVGRKFAAALGPGRKEYIPPSPLDRLDEDWTLTKESRLRAPTELAPTPCRETV